MVKKLTITAALAARDNYVVDILGISPPLWLTMPFSPV
jgi:hypothetical protein